MTAPDAYASLTPDAERALTDELAAARAMGRQAARDGQTGWEGHWRSYAAGYRDAVCTIYGRAAAARIDAAAAKPAAVAAVWTSDDGTEGIVAIRSTDPDAA